MQLWKMSVNNHYTVIEHSLQIEHENLFNNIHKHTSTLIEQL